MPGMTAKAFDAADEVRKPEKATMDVVDLAGNTAMRLTAEPGWRWSVCIKPVVAYEFDSSTAQAFGRGS